MGGRGIASSLHASRGWSVLAVWVALLMIVAYVFSLFICVYIILDLLFVLDVCVFVCYCYVSFSFNPFSSPSLSILFSFVT